MDVILFLSVEMK